MGKSLGVKLVLFVIIVLAGEGRKQLVGQLVGGVEDTSVHGNQSG